MKPECAHVGKASFLLTGSAEPGVIQCLECMHFWPAQIAPVELVNRLTKHLLLLATDRNIELS